MDIIAAFTLDPDRMSKVVDWGLPLAATGMTIVFCSLALISIYIGTLPKILALLERYLPEEKHDVQGKAVDTSLNKKVIAAIGYALHHHKNN